MSKYGCFPQQYCTVVCISTALQIAPWQVVMAYSPLELMRELHTKHIYASGQENVLEIARGLGFAAVSTAEDICAQFPTLDLCDLSKRKRLSADALQPSSRPPFRPIDAIVLFSEPTRWETQLQLMLDLLLTGGDPRTIVGGGAGGACASRGASGSGGAESSAVACGCGCDPSPVGPRTHPSLMTQRLPVIACNADLLWMAEPRLPRLGHGSYLRCLETLFEVRQLEQRVDMSGCCVRILVYT